MYKAVYPGSFDPLTKGHLEIIERVSKLYDKVYVLIADNVNKKTIFTDNERIKMLKLVTKKFKNFIIDKTDGLVVYYFLCIYIHMSSFLRRVKCLFHTQNVSKVKKILKPPKTLVNKFLKKHPIYPEHIITSSKKSLFFSKHLKLHLYN